ncbi:hypothetical protein AOLI_G00085010 [Acnodon oligacanthus]
MPVLNRNMKTFDKGLGDRGILLCRYLHRKHLPPQTHSSPICPALARFQLCWHHDLTHQSTTHSTQQHGDSTRRTPLNNVLHSGALGKQ